MLRFIESESLWLWILIIIAITKYKMRYINRIQKVTWGKWCTGWNTYYAILILNNPVNSFEAGCQAPLYKRITKGYTLLL